MTGIVLATLPDAIPFRRVQVLLLCRRDGVAFGLREQHYSAGIGWFEQRGLELGPGQLLQLLQVVRTGRATPTADEVEGETILRFPGPRPDRKASARATRPQINTCRIFRDPASQSPLGRVEEGERGRGRRDHEILLPFAPQGDPPRRSGGRHAAGS